MIVGLTTQWKNKLCGWKVFTVNGALGRLLGCLRTEEKAERISQPRNQSNVCFDISAP